MHKKGISFIIILITMLSWSLGGTLVYGQDLPQFTQEEQAFIEKTQKGAPLTMGIIPHIFPLSSCPPDTEDFEGILVDTLALVQEKSGLVFQYVRVPTEEGTPYDFLKTGGASLVAGTIRLPRFSDDKELILSDRLGDGSSVYIAKKGFCPENPKLEKVASTYGYQAGIDNVAEEYGNYEVVLYHDNTQALAAVRRGEVDMVVTSRYTGMYELEKPRNESLVSIPSKMIDVDSCVMGLNQEENDLAISIINKALAVITPGEYNHVQMNFIISNPYTRTISDVLYLYRYFIGAGVVLLVTLIWLSRGLTASKKEKKMLCVDSLTGAYTEQGFRMAGERAIAKGVAPLFIVDFDVLNFQGYNELHGRDAGDGLLRSIVQVAKGMLETGDIICRVYADDFRLLCAKESVEALIETIKQMDERFKEKAQGVILLSYGIYCVTNTTVPIAQMLDFAMQAKKAAKNTSDKSIGIFDTVLHQRNLKETEMFALFQSAIDSKAFLAYYQPKVDAITREIIGAEALVRWQQKDGTILSPYHFIDLFEKHGQIRRLDFYMLNQVCMLQKRLLEAGGKVVPISVNFSRVHLLGDHLVSWINDVVERNQVPKHLIEIEWTETAIMNDNVQTEKILKELQKNGYIVSMDDFGSAYSSLNTLCNMPLDVMKLDREFMLNTMDEAEKKRNKALKIVSSIIDLAHSLDLKVVAEGVENKVQYEFLKEIGCDYIQGYYFFKPVEEKDFVALLGES